MSPLFVLYDFRVAASHLTSREAASEIMQKVTERLTLPESADLQTTYARLLEELSKTFRALVELFPSPKE
jgi:hypothetical protein